MAITINDIGDAVNTYPAANVTLSIVDLVVQPPDQGPSVNVGETWAFQVRVANTGDLNMTDLHLHVLGLNGATVCMTANGNFVSSIFPVMGNVSAHSTQDTWNLYFRPSLVKPANTALISVHVESFDANLDYVLNGRSGYANPPSGTYSNQVFPN